jgi:hypothetical protein
MRPSAICDIIAYMSLFQLLVQSETASRRVSHCLRLHYTGAETISCPQISPSLSQYQNHVLIQANLEFIHVLKSRYMINGYFFTLKTYSEVACRNQSQQLLDVTQTHCKETNLNSKLTQELIQLSGFGGLLISIFDSQLTIPNILPLNRPLIFFSYLFFLLSLYMFSYNVRIRIRQAMVHHSIKTHCT